MFNKYFLFLSLFTILISVASKSHAQGVPRLIENLQDDILQLQLIVNETNGENEQQQADLNELREQISELDSLIVDTRLQVGVRLNILEDQLQSLQDLPAAVIDLRDYINSLKALFWAFKNKVLGLKTLPIMVEKLQISIISINDTLDNLSQQVDDSLASIAMLDEQVVINNSLLSSILEEVSTLKNRINQLENDNSSGNAVEVLYSEQFDETTNLVSASFTLQEPGILFIQAAGIAGRTGNAATAAITVGIEVDGVQCAADRNLETPSSNVTFLSSASCVLTLQPGPHDISLIRNDHGITRDRVLEGSATVIRMQTSSQ